MTRNKELLLEISYKCNLNCIHCSSVGCHNQTLSLNDVKTALTNDVPLSKNASLYEIDTVRISGGEPILNSNINDYINFFKDNNIKVVLQTNGTSELTKYMNLDVDKIWISFYGDLPTHNFITMDNTYYKVRNNIINLQEYINVTIQSTIFNESQITSLLHEIYQLDIDFELSKNNVKLRLFALLNQGRCKFALPIKKQLEIYNNLHYRYKNTELTCSLDPTKCNYENKLVLKPDGSLFNCASHKHGMTLCKK